MSEKEQTLQSNPWKMATIAIVSAVAAALISGVVVAKVHQADDAKAAETTTELELDTVVEPEPVAEATPEPVTTPAPAPTPAPVATPVVYREDCEKYAQAADRKGREVAKDSVMGAAVGAGLGAATGAIAKGGKGAGKGAGIGALVGLAGGTLYGVNQENQRTQAARNAYYNCKARQS